LKYRLPFADLNEWTHTPDGQAVFDRIMLSLIVVSVGVAAVYRMGVLC
jgi:hypothetical protein